MTFAARTSCVPCFAWRAKRTELRMVSDQFGAPTWARALPKRRPSCWHERWSATVKPAPGKADSFISRLRARRRGPDLRRRSWKTTKRCSAWPADTGEFGGPLKAKRVVAITTDQYQTPTPAGPAIRCFPTPRCKPRSGSCCRTGAASCGLPCRTRFADNREYHYSVAEQLVSLAVRRASHSLLRRKYAGEFCRVPRAVQDI